MAKRCFCIHLRNQFQTAHGNNLYHALQIVHVQHTNGLDPMGIKEIRLLLKERLKSPQHCILVSSHNLTEIAAVTDVLIFIRGGKIIKVVENDYNEKELEALYEDIMTSGQREEA